MRELRPAVRQSSEAHRYWDARFVCLNRDIRITHCSLRLELLGDGNSHERICALGPWYLDEPSAVRGPGDVYEEAMVAISADLLCNPVSARRTWPRSSNCAQSDLNGVIAVPPNKWLQLTCRFVTPLAGARGAPNRPAAEPGC